MPTGPFYDAPSSLYDTGLHYADSPGPTTKKAMAKIKLNLARMNAAQIISKATVIHGSIAPAAPATPPIPNLTARAAALLTAKDDAEAAEAEYQAALSVGANKKVVRDQKVDALREELRRTAGSAQSESNGDPAMLTAGGFDLAETASATTEAPPKVANLYVTAGDIDGTVTGGFDPSPPDANTSTYEIQCTTVDPVTGPWATVLNQSDSSFSVGGLTSGQRCWIRARAINVVGPGGWSDPATKIVP
jgi:hypothetical protein